MTTASDSAVMRRLLTAHSLADVTRLLIQIGDEMERQALRVGPPTLADVVDLGDYRRSRRRRDRPQPTPAA